MQEPAPRLSDDEAMRKGLLEKECIRFTIQADELREKQRTGTITENEARRLPLAQSEAARVGHELQALEFGQDRQWKLLNELAVRVGFEGFLINRTSFNDLYAGEGGDNFVSMPQKAFQDYKQLLLLYVSDAMRNEWEAALMLLFRFEKERKRELDAARVPNDADIFQRINQNPNLAEIAKAIVLVALIQRGFTDVATYNLGLDRAFFEHNLPFLADGERRTVVSGVQALQREIAEKALSLTGSA